MSDIQYFTKEGLENLRSELKHMESVERAAISQQIAEARDKGDLSENAEYDAAKEAQGMLEMRIAKMQVVIRNARIVDESKMDTDKVLIFTKVKIRNKNNNAIMNYTLVPENEADIKNGKISVSSPIAKGLLGKKVGEVAEIRVPAGLIPFEIIEIDR